MELFQLLAILGVNKPLVAVEGNIFETPAEHIAFAVHYPASNGFQNNGGSGFASEVKKYGWHDMFSTDFVKGEPQSRKIKGKWFHALPVHSHEPGGWSESPELIERCLNKLKVPNRHVIASVLIGGGDAGHTYNASIRNLEGMIRSTKTVVLYINDNALYQLLAAVGITANGMPASTNLLERIKRYELPTRAPYNSLLAEINDN